MAIVNSYTSWQPLEEVIVGRAYTPDYFDFIDDAQVRNQLQQILAETNEDLDNLQHTIEQYGATVKRPDLPNKGTFQEWQTSGNGAPLPPLTPRDWQITLGEKLLRVLPMQELDTICADYGDAVFAILKPGVLLSSKWDDQLDLAGDFPGWDVCKIWDPSIWAAMEVGKFKEENFNGAWYIQGQTPTAEFTQFVDTYLNKWVGYVSDTVFDVNCLVLDEENVIFSAYNKQVFDYCEKHRINPIISELRHSYFWDGGVSCCTQDIRRRGGLEDYI